MVERLEEAEKLRSMKIEIMQTALQHEITEGQLRSRASSRSSVCSHLSTASKAESRKENRNDDNQHNQKCPFGTLLMQPRTMKKLMSSPTISATRSTAHSSSLEIETFQVLYHPMRKSKTRTKTKPKQTKGHNKINLEFQIYFSIKN